MPNSRSALRANTRKRIQEKCNNRVRGHHSGPKRWWGPRTCAKRKRVERAKRERRRFFGDDYDGRQRESQLQVNAAATTSPHFSLLIYYFEWVSFAFFFFFFPPPSIPIVICHLTPNVAYPCSFFPFLMTQITTPICRFSFQTKKGKKKMKSRLCCYPSSP